MESIETDGFRESPTEDKRVSVDISNDCFRLTIARCSEI
jgi:hypothetical protein